MPTYPPQPPNSPGCREEAWYALRVKPKHEKSVAAALRLKGYTELLPVYKSRHRSGRGYRSVELPLFPGYLFCRFDPRMLLPILKTHGVHYVVGYGKTLCPVDPAEIESLKRALEAGAQMEPCEYIAAGTVVQISAGPLAGVRGILQSYRNNRRVILSVSLLLRSVAVEIDKEWMRLDPMDAGGAGEHNRPRNLI